MTNDLAIASLCVDIAGAILLARALVLQPPSRYAEENPGPLAPRSANPRQDLAHARSYADARVGLSLLLIGFAGQAVASAAVDPLEAWAYPLAGLCIAVGLPARGWIRRRRERAVYLAQLSANPNVAESAHKAWWAEMQERGRDDELEEWAEWATQRLGKDLRTPSDE